MQSPVGNVGFFESICPEIMIIQALPHSENSLLSSCQEKGKIFTPQTREEGYRRERGRR